VSVYEIFSNIERKNWGARSLIIVPLMARIRIHGVITLFQMSLTVRMGL
jgi:hypothetical protein